MHMMELFRLGNSFIFQLKNGHFLISDGGMATDLPYLLDYLDSLVPEGEKPIVDGWIISHAHGDHFHSSVVEWMKAGKAALVTGCDVDAGGIRLSPGEQVEVDGVTVEAFGSTDEGVSFLVGIGGVIIFHAGDLNFWHWKHESDEEYVREAEQAFMAVLETIRGRKIDLAFFPVDPRMGEGHEEGALRFIEAVRPCNFIPMHFWDEPGAAQAMKQKELPEGVSVIVMTRPGETVSI
jgi:L-ascorbate metabolism protein UlaG (beta-lactamase superfamily)